MSGIAGRLFAVSAAASTLILGGFTIHQTQDQRANSCSDAAVVAAEATVPALDPATMAKRITIPSGEPAIVATVNGTQITAVELEAQVSIAYQERQQTVANLGENPSVPASIQGSLDETQGQLRRDMLKKLIDNQLYLQDAARRGITISPAQAEAVARREIAQFETMEVSDPARISFQAYLCLNHLTIATFATNPVVLRRAQEALTISIVNQQIIASLSPSQRRNPAVVQAALTAYVQHLWQSGDIRIFITLQ